MDEDERVLWELKKAAAGGYARVAVCGQVWVRIDKPHPERNAEIVRRVLAGERQTAVAEAFGISQPRVHSIVKTWRKRREVSSAA